MPSVVHRRLPPPRPARGGGSGDVGKVLSGIVGVVLVGLALYQGSASAPPARRALSTRGSTPQWDSPPPPGHSIKGNISVTTGARLYHLPGMEDYDATVVDASRGAGERLAQGWAVARAAVQARQETASLPPKKPVQRTRPASRFLSTALSTKANADRGVRAAPRTTRGAALLMRSPAWVPRSRRIRPVPRNGPPASRNPSPVPRPEDELRR